jgi:hypothetical protein
MQENISNHKAYFQIKFPTLQGKCYKSVYPWLITNSKSSTHCSKLALQTQKMASDA